MSCLFRALGRFVDTDEVTMRQKICDFMRSDPEIIGDVKLSEIVKMQSDIKINDDHPLVSYIYEMTNPNVMGGAIEIQIFTKIFVKNVRVYTTREQDKNKTIEFICDNSLQNSWIELIWSGNHYEPK